MNKRFAMQQLLTQSQNRVPNLPEFCYVAAEGKTVIVKNGEAGYYDLDYKEQRSPEEMNVGIGVTKQQAAALYGGSLFGFHTLAADVSRYDENDQPIRKGK